jgi:ABC-type antimicrobial peptide transport system permease subunit
MIQNYLVITFRNFIRNKDYALINILGLSIGITCCIIIYLMIMHDLSFDRFHSKANSIYRITRDSGNSSGIEKSAVTPYPFAAAFRNDFPEISLMTQFHEQDELTVAIGKEKFMLEDALFADSMFFDVFDFEVVSGNPKRDLAQTGKVFLTESTAKKLLKDDGNPTMRLDNLLDVEVAGIIKDPPPNSEIQFNMIVSMPSFRHEFIGFPIDNWGVHSSGYSYVMIVDESTKAGLENRFSNFVKKYYKKSDWNTVLGLQPLSEIHFNDDYNDDAVDKVRLLVLGVLGIFILSIACMNFVNLATALAIKKSKEIGIRKTLGAERTHLAFYFLGETFVITMVAVLISLGIVEWILPWLNFFLEKQLNMSIFSDVNLILFLFAIILFVTICSGLYPGIILSGYNPAVVLKNKLGAVGSAGTSVRKVLVVFQFMIAQALIIGTLIVGGQMSYFRTKPLGFNKDLVINVSMPKHETALLKSFRTKLETNKNIEMISYSIGAPVTDNGLGTNFSLAGEEEENSYDVALKVADINYAETYGLQMLSGMWITEAEEKQATPDIADEDRKYVFVINESAVKQLGFTDVEEVIGKDLTIGLNGITGQVIGVVKDFHTTSMHETINPVILLNFPQLYYDAGIKINASNMAETLAFIESAWTALNPDYYFEYSFLDVHLANLYRQEERTFTLFQIFAVMAIFIACLGLYGLISFMANQKLKEVGIRKVMGATAGSIVFLFSKEFIRLIIIAFLVAAPLAWYFMGQWLESFAYHVEIHWSVFLIAICSTLVIALLTVSYRAMKAALTNPVNTLRTE